MKFIISENKRNELAFKMIDNFFNESFGGLEAVSNEDNFYQEFFWYPKNKNFDSDYVDTEKPFFYKNFYGNLWPMNCYVWKKIILIGFSLSLDLDAIKNLTIEYFSKKFEVKIKGFRSECYNTEQDFLD